MDTSYVAEFIALTRSLNFTKTAADFSISQPTLSRHITMLEEELSITLFQRDSKSVQLTEEGKIFLPYAVQIMDKVEEAKNEIYIYHKKEEDSLTIAFRPLFTNDYFLHNVSEKFSARYPKVTLKYFSHSELIRLLHELKKGLADVVLFAIPNTATVESLSDWLHMEVNYRRIRGIRLCAAMDIGHPFATKKEICFADLNNQTVVLPDESLHGRIYTEAYKSIIESNHVTGQRYVYGHSLHAVELSLGKLNAINIIPECYSVDSFDSRSISIPVKNTEDSFYLVYLWKRSNKNLYINALIDSDVL